jgi:hypothetical protein
VFVLLTQMQAPLFGEELLVKTESSTSKYFLEEK